MKTDNGMVFKVSKDTTWGWDEIFWPIVKRHLQPGWKCGKTRFYTLKCGHYFSCPAADSTGKGKTAECIYCEAVWRWLTRTSFRSGIIEHALRTVNPDILMQMHIDARKLGKLLPEHDEGGPLGYLKQGA